jgi:hypothetical protein
LPTVERYDCVHPGIWVAASNCAELPTRNPTNNHSYVFQNINVTWGFAAQLAQRFTFNGSVGQLPVITSHYENEFVLQVASTGGSTNNTWLGGFRPVTLTPFFTVSSDIFWFAGQHRGRIFFRGYHRYGSVDVPLSLVSPFNYSNFELRQPIVDGIGLSQNQNVGTWFVCVCVFLLRSLSSAFLIVIDSAGVWSG